mmetsp:Transcript_56270/g.68797  ORF Transcript_56270/g.68797 Transcript_56270/m.68797 type:complete len:168 (+) Transcript_56270:65-568(+)
MDETKESNSKYLPNGVKRLIGSLKNRKISIKKLDLSRFKEMLKSTKKDKDKQFIVNETKGDDSMDESSINDDNNGDNNAELNGQQSNMIILNIDNINNTSNDNNNNNKCGMEWIDQQLREKTPESPSFNDSSNNNNDNIYMYSDNTDDISFTGYDSDANEILNDLFN